jgi:hypothetical protein
MARRNKKKGYESIPRVDSDGKIYYIKLRKGETLDSLEEKKPRFRIPPIVFSWVGIFIFLVLFPFILPSMGYEIRETQAWPNKYIFGPLEKSNWLLISWFGWIAELVFGLAMMYLFLKYLYTFAAYFALAKGAIGLGSGSSSSSGLGEIERVLNYRDAKLGTLNNEGAADLMRRTAFLDNAVNLSRNSSEVRRSVTYMNAKLSNMNNEQALKYISSK